LKTWLCIKYSNARTLGRDYSNNNEQYFRMRAVSGAGMPVCLLRSPVPRLLKSVSSIRESTYGFDGSDLIFALSAISTEQYQYPISGGNTRTMEPSRSLQRFWKLDVGINSIHIHVCLSFLVVWSFYEERILVLGGCEVWGQIPIIGVRGLDPGLLALWCRLAALLWASWMQAVGYERVSLRIALCHLGKESHIHTADIY
jgi:hypothetical protein